MRLSTLLALSSALATTACATVQTTHPGEVGIERQQRMLLTLGDVNEAAAREYSNLLGQASRTGSLDSDPNQLARVNAITEALIAQTSVFREDAPSWPWEVHVIRSREVNAWCMPGGKIAVYTGFLDVLRPTDAELAAVIGHEIAHALREHARERMSEALATGLLFNVAVAALKIDERKAALGDLLLKVTFTLPNSRLHEREADVMGVELAARAGFDPAAAATMHQKMARVSGGSDLDWLSTHPSSETRIQDVTFAAQQVASLYQQALGRLAQARVQVPEPRAPPAPLVEAPPPGPATLSVGTSPLAAIFVNGNRTSSNPLVNYEVPPGAVSLRFEIVDATGTWAEERVLTLSPGEHRNLGRLALARSNLRSPAAVAHLTVGTRPLARISVNGKRVPANPLIDYPVPAGLVRLRFEVANVNGAWVQELTITLSPGEQRNLGRIQLVRP